MANELNVFAVDSAVVASARVSSPVVRRGPFGDLERTEEISWLETFPALDQEDRVEWLFEQPDGVRWLGDSFRYEYMVILDLQDRIVRHLDDPALAEALSQDAGGSRTPPDAGPVARALAQGTWRVYTREEMTRLAAAIRAALEADAEWADDLTEFGPVWRRLASELENADEDLYVWAFWN